MSPSPAPALSALPRGSAARTTLFAAVIFVEAFLLFQVQFLIGKHILPWFGGTSAVWITCLFFFQVLLFAGYFYSHATGSLEARSRFRVHSALLLFSVAVMVVAGFFWPSPITPASPIGPMRAPTVGVLATLLLSVGLPFWLLSTSPLLQDWYARAHATPYRMYALSNTGSLLGLLSYPFLVEPRLTIRQQAWTWCAAYGLFVAGSIACGWISRTPDPPTQKDAAPSSTAVGASRYLLWLALPAATSALLLANTNYITQDMASMPMLWVMPLALYLLSFIMAFARDWSVPRWLLWPALTVSFAFGCDGLFVSGYGNLRQEVLYQLGMVFFGCLCAHAELARLKPEPRLLTTFYLCIAGGSCVGSALVALVAPHLFPDVWEYHVALLAIPLLALVAMLRDSGSWVRTAPPWKLSLLTAAVGFGPLCLLTGFRQYAPQLFYILCAGGTLLVVMAAALVWSKAERPWARRVGYAGLFMPLLGTALVLLLNVGAISGAVRMRSRNFYGVLKVIERDRGNPNLDDYELYHGRVLHGVQLRNPALRHRATTYYTNLSGVALALRFHPRRWNPDPHQRDLRFGVIGMGVGTVLIYGNPGDYARVYEINPAIEALSRGPDPYFTYLRDTLATTDVVLGDARISLQEEADRGDLQRFDVIVLDAFNGDSIPTHLLTRQALQLYLRHLRDSDGIIAIHITNRFLNLDPVVSRLAQELNLEGTLVKVDPQGSYIQQSEWILLSPGTSPLRTPAGVRLDPLGTPGPLWTDDFSDLFSILRESALHPQM